VNSPLLVLLVAAIAHVAGYVLLAFRVEPFMYNFYLLSWWSYIAIVDASLALKRKRFLIFNQNLPFWMIVSSAFWCVFELINLRLENWYYINIPDSSMIRFFGYLAAYGTVIPALYVTKEALSALLGDVPIKPIKLSAYLPYSLPLGILLFLLFMLFPAYLFSFAWIFLIPIGEGYCYARNYSCFTRELEQGKVGNLLATLLSGLVSGFLWESWNYWAVSKWVYTVPFFESFKIFEMPLLGYVGFVLFAVEAVLAHSFVSESGHVARHRWAVAAAALIFSSASFALIDRHTIFSYLAEAQRLPFLTDESRDYVKRAKVQTTFAIDPQILNAEEREMLTILHLRGLGLANTVKLREHGIQTVKELSGLTDAQLAAIIGESNLRRARIYTSAARHLAQH
jgi:hypothetical protein